MVGGRSQGRRLALKVQLVYEEGSEYWINGLVPATVATPKSDDFECVREMADGRDFRKEFEHKKRIAI